jgi:uncharacterized membrane protein (UPF0127 family)
MRTVRILNRTRPLKTELTASLAESFGAKLRGLMFRPALPASEALVLAEATESRLGTGIHMLGMRFDLCIVWLDGELHVVDVQLARRWVSLLLPRKPARYVIECAPSRHAEFHLDDQIEFKDT